MKIVLTGASGFVGTALVPFLQARGCEVVRLVRRKPSSPDEAQWDPNARTLDPACLRGADVLIHLSGENIASGRWTASRKDRIRRSRVDTTQLLAETLGAMDHPPRVWLNASAIGIYGDRGDTPLTEESEPGTGFLAEVTREWEAAAGKGASRSIRTVLLRFGLILDCSGGALPKMLPVFRLGLGGRVGSGRQWWSWIALEDVLRVVDFAISSDDLAGPINVVSPQPVTNLQFTGALAAALHRPAVLPLPAFAARLALGEMAGPTLLASARVIPERLGQGGFRFQFSDLKAALPQLLQASR